MFTSSFALVVKILVKDWVACIEVENRVSTVHQHAIEKRAETFISDGRVCRPP